MTTSITTTINASIILNPGTAYSITGSGGVVGTTGTNPTGTHTHGNTGSTGVQISGNTLINSGHIYGGTGSKDAYSSGYGHPGTGGVGLVETGGVVINTGTIIGGAGGYGDVVSNPSSAQYGGNGGYGVVITGGTFINMGVIRGGYGAQVAGYGHQHYAAKAGTAGNGVSISNGLFITSGYIYGGGGTAIHASNSTIVIESGAVEAGNIIGDASSTLEAGGNTPFVISLIGTGSKFSGFGNLEFGSTLGGFGLSGNTLGLASGQVISGMVAGDVITITGFAATSESFNSSGQLVLTNSGGVHETLDLVGITGAEAFSLSSNGTNSTISAIAAVTTISTAVTPGVVLETGHYSNLLTVTSTGTITGTYRYTSVGTTGGTGLTSPVNATLINQGTITGGLSGQGQEVTGSGQTAPNGPNGSTGVSLVGGIFNNSGLTVGGRGGKGGYSLYGQAGTGGTGGTGLIISGAETVTNSGTISGGKGGPGGNTDFGSLGNGGTGGTGVSASSGLIINTGVITTGAGGAGGTGFHGGTGGSGSGGDGVYLSGATLVNYGTITGGGAGVAVRFGAAAATLVIENGAVFNGNVVANAAVADVLEFAGTGASKFTGIGTQELNFKQISFASGAAWTLEAAAANFTSGETFAGFTSSDQLILDGFAATGETLNAGVLSLTGAATQTLVLGAATDNFVVLEDGTNTTLSLSPAHIGFTSNHQLLAGHSAALAGTSITGFTQGDTINLEGFSATSSTFVAGVGLVLSNGSTHETLAINSVSGDFFRVVGDGTNTTITAVPIVSIISGLVVEGGSTGPVVNMGGGTYATALTVTSTGTVTNSGSPAISAGAGLTGVSLINQGVVHSDGGADAVSLQSAAYIKNTGTIDGSTGIYLAQGGTIYNAGYIGGVQSVYAKGALTLTETPDGSLGTGHVTGGAGSTLVLAAGAGAQVGSIDVTNFAGFSNIDFANGASWSIAATDGLGLNGVTLNGFTVGDTIDLKGFHATSKAYADGQLVLNGTYTGGIAQSITLDIAGDFTTGVFNLVDDGAGGTDIIPCFVTGTHIATPRGEVKVEELRTGDMVLTADGGSVPIRWIGVRSVATRFADRLRNYPIRISAGALGEAIPARDLLVSPDHAMFLCGLLVQAGALVNGTSITREQTMPENFTYYHIEAAGHELILAEGAVTESFVDNVERMNFDNWAEHEALHRGVAPIAELPYPRVKSARQLPLKLRSWLAAALSA